jgi:putative addiction module killer protein
MKVVEYLDPAGRSPFEAWFRRIEARAAAKVTVALARLEGGNLSNTKTVGSGVLEYRIDYGPGIVFLFRARWRDAGHPACRRHEQRQQRDIADAQARWLDYKRRKRGD